MKKLMIGIAIVLASVSAQADTYVNGYTRSDGTYVQPHHRSDANEYRYDNYSSHGNTNPYTGESGYQRNEYTTPPAYNQSYGGGSNYGYSYDR